MFPSTHASAMEFSQQSLVFASLLLPLFLWLLHQASPRSMHTNGGDRRQIPSPPALPVLGHLHLLKKPLHRSLAALAARYAREGGAGLLHLRFGAKPVVLVTSPAVAEECFTAHDVALADRPGGLASRRLLTQDCPAIAMCSYGPLWRQLRRLATVHALCAHRLAATSAARDAEARAMAADLWRRTRASGAGDGRLAVVAVKAAAYEFAANVIMGMVAGTRMSGDQVRRFREITEAGLAAAGAANRHDSLPFLRLLDFGRTRRRLAGIAVARRQFGQSILDDYRRRHQRHSRSHPGGAADDGAGETTATRTVLGDLFRQQQQQEEQSPELLDDVVIRSVCLSLLQAGTDTTASTIEWAMALLLTNPSAVKKATAEIDAVVGKSRLLRESDLAGLPYLRCVVSETLRLYPLAPNHVPHEASRDIVLAAAGGHAVARGTMVLVDVYSMQRDLTIWGEQSEEFVPERFMEDGTGSGGGGGGDGGWMMPFGMGRRKCPGEGLALRMVGVVLGVMLQCFEWERDGGKEVDMSEGSGLTMPMATPLVAVCRPRAEMESLLKAL